MKKLLAGAAVAAAMMAGSASAATFGWVVEGGGAAKVYQLQNGNFLGLMGIDVRNSQQTGGTVAVNPTSGSEDLGDSLQTGSILNYYWGTSSLNGGASEFDLASGDLDLVDGERYFDAFWVEWAGGNLTFSNGKGGTATLGDRVTLDGDPISTAPVPLPAALPLLLSAFGGLAFLRSRRKAAAA